MTIQYNSNFEGTVPFSDTSFQVHLVTSVDQTITVPGIATMQYQAEFEYASNSNVFVCKNSIAIIPGTTVPTTQQYNAFKPCKRYVKGGDVLHLITPDTEAYVGVTLMQIPG